MTRRVLFEKVYLKFRILKDENDIIVCRGFCRNKIEKLLEDEVGKLIYVYASLEEFEAASLLKKPITSDWVTLFELSKNFSDNGLLFHHNNKMEALKKQNEYWRPVGQTTNGKIMFDLELK